MRTGVASSGRLSISIGWSELTYLSHVLISAMAQTFTSFNKTAVRETDTGREEQAFLAQVSCRILKGFKNHEQCSLHDA